METIKDIRQSTGLSQTQFGAALNIPMRTIQDWEQGKRKCPEYVAELIEYRVENDPTIPKTTPLKFAAKYTYPFPSVTIVPTSKNRVTTRYNAKSPHLAKRWGCFGIILCV